MNILAGRYEIIQQLGGGGFAVTYLAKDHLQPSKPLCVVKQLHPHHSHRRIVDFFEKEAAILEKLGKYQQIPQLLAHFRENQNLYIVQEFIEGQDLGQEIIRGLRLSENYVNQLLQDVLEVLSCVHNQGVVHRDLKPQNLMRRKQDSKIFLIDFGAVKELVSLQMSTQGELASSVIIGTPGYMPNEQKNGKPSLATDVYALGIIAIQALTGIEPVNLPEDPQTGEIIWRDQVQVNEHLAEVLTKMVRRHVTLRYPSAREVLTALTTPPTIIFNNVRQQYFQEAATRAQQLQGQFSVFALKMLESKRIELGLSEAEAQKIHAEVVQPYQEYKRKLQEYEQALIVAVNQQYPFNQCNPQELQEYRQHLGLRAEDIATIEAKVLALQKRENLGKGVMLEMLAIPGGEFLMGSPENEPERSNSESPQHNVTIQPFLMGKFPVTQVQWSTVATLPKVNIELNPDPSHFKGVNRPVDRVSWHDALEFCARLTLKTGKNYRLPNEAEWEYACRAGTTTPFYFGTTMTTDLANYKGSHTYGLGLKGKYREQTTDVGIFAPNAFGLYDMHGLVWEWCEDTWHENYNEAPTDGSAWVGGDDYRLLRGGSWTSNPGYCRSANRFRLMSGSKYNSLSFRVVVSSLRIA
ncbi:bifunctional serine/threonine-protein kinase/formylglycine-generating enzyme family protein [Anabaena cylindrica UHCC 0172]|uniref:bifunctional serine/threonine-protein kinase/formylglycine-generating enzyme family protein n=1 Tax=Anabaena cylindrica TaxID=1165 RepID=UPI002B1FF8B3|nr:bifunctional serine/threonine-protein kinase/formylglycine-generating enzyme family protein [Anabaena cylindrica]MEA5554527.1 bifunctional serine/threonine-protein kinase/formylglycine-generating enzyme family protein [Anabaena cylindrica UHCC 0172]